MRAELRVISLSPAISFLCFFGLMHGDQQFRDLVFTADAIWEICKQGKTEISHILYWLITNLAP